MKKHSLFLSIILVLFWSLTAYALDVTDFHESYTRDKGKPVTVADSFTSNYQGEGKITFTNGDPNDPKVKLITSAWVWFNGKPISRPNDWNSNVTLLVKPVTLKKGKNTLEVRLEEPRGGKISLSVTHEVDIDEGYIRPLDSSKTTFYDSSGTKIVRDQLLMYFNPEISEQEILNIINNINGIIVGYIPKLELYQIELLSIDSITELKNILNALKLNPNIEHVTTNKIYGPSEVIPDPGNDPMWFDGNSDTWNQLNPQGRNWGLEAIKMPSAWQVTTGGTLVKIGVIDGGFLLDIDPFTPHDFDLPHENVLSADGEPLSSDQNPHECFPEEPLNEIRYNNHGTHVLGTIGAWSNNPVGITGIMWEKDLYAYRTDYQQADIIFGITRLLVNGVKVINVSIGTPWYDPSTCHHCSELYPDECPSFDDQDDKDKWDRDYEDYSMAMHYWVDILGYDFLIVQSAGNWKIDATWNLLFTNLAEPYKDRVILVGSIDPPIRDNEKWEYKLWDGSNHGDLIDIVAPGSDIYSTIAYWPYFGYKTGTSMAAPHVTGVAGLVWNLDPNLTAQQVKNILVNTADREFVDGRGDAYKILNARAAVEPSPQVTAFDVQPRSITDGDSTTASYTVYDNQSLAQVELWQAPYSDTNCSDTDKSGCAWTQRDSQNVTGNIDSGNFTDDPSSGTWWYGIHVVDTDDNCTTEENKDCTSGTPNGGADFGPISVTVTLDDFPVLFPDSNLEAAIREAISKPTGDIMYSDLLGLTSLDARWREITDLEGLQYCSNLETLQLWGCQILDISLLSELTNLIFLNIGYCQITDISPLSKLTNLNWLAMSQNQITDISPLSELKKLVGLGAYMNEISDITPLAGLVNLESIDLSFNPIIHINPLAGLTKLRGLVLSDNNISDITPLTGLVNLEGLHLRNMQISDISPLAGLTKLRGLNVWGNQISDISPLAGLINLNSYLHLENNQISDIGPLVSNSGIVSGTRIYLNENPLSTTSCDTYILELTARGVEVCHSCPPPVLTGVSAVHQSWNNWNYITWDAHVVDQWADCRPYEPVYHVYWSTSPGVTKSSNMLDPTTTTDYGHSGVQSGYTYYYRVAVMANYWNYWVESDLSAEVSAYVP